MKISVCIDMMYTYCDFYERFTEAAADGIQTIEFWKWSNKDLDRVCSLLRENGQQVSIFNLDSHDEKLSFDLSRGILNDGRVAEFLQALKESIPVYKKLDAKAMIVLIGEHKPYHEENVFKCLAAAKPILEAENVNLIVEPLNATDRVGYCMPYAKPVFSLIEKMDSPHIKMLYDLYHQSMTEDFDLEDIHRKIGLIGHFHVADAPGRHEPGTGNVNYVHILSEIAAMPFEGFVGLEYRATKRDGETYGFLKEVGYGF
ncbi:MAG: TIM barrel protein [Lachnospiraceae bacterium]|nr:TIM barrel protein [Lachnospiraceae bacterium]